MSQLYAHSELPLGSSFFCDVTQRRFVISNRTMRRVQTVNNTTKCIVLLTVFILPIVLYTQRGWHFPRLVIEVSGQPIGPIFKGQAVHETSVISYPCSLRNIPEERRCHLQCGRKKTEK